MKARVATRSSLKNRLLLALPPRDLKELLPHLEEIECPRDQVLLDADSALDDIFFPQCGVISVVAVYTNGSTIEMATVGREGCTGFQAFFGARRSSARFLIQLPGAAIKMPSKVFRHAIESMASFRALMQSYVHAFLEQVMVSAACNGSHSLNQRLARWLLTLRDRSDDDRLALTQHILAEMLGVHRPSVTGVVRALERRRLIKSARGAISIVDRPGLMRASCECYELVRMRLSSHLPKTYP
jgi:CRP-like cAMP-binding protein